MGIWHLLLINPTAALNTPSFRDSPRSSQCEAHIFDDSLEKAVPSRFVEGTKNDPPGTAEKRWAITAAWRKRDNIDTIILQPHPYYNEIKRCYPHFYCRTDLTNKQIAYYERPGFLQLKRLEEIGVPTMVWHYTFQIEFCWTYMSTMGEQTRTLSGVDVQNVGLYDVKGVVKEFLAAISKVSQEHYPERAGKICVLNAPGWFSMLWNVIKVRVLRNIDICSRTPPVCSIAAVNSAAISNISYLFLPDSLTSLVAAHAPPQYPEEGLHLVRIGGQEDDENPHRPRVGPD